jgi:uracil phosphoribosyltransferase
LNSSYYLFPQQGEQEMSVHVVDHPLVSHRLGLMRKDGISTMHFRMLATEIARFLVAEASKDLKVEPVMVQGWAEEVETLGLAGKKPTLVPILRAGIGLLWGALDMFPGGKVSIVGFYRDDEDPDFKPVRYYDKLANKLDQRRAFVLDPMLATGGTMDATINLLKEDGCTDIKALVLIAAPEGLARMKAQHPDVDIFTAAIDRELDENAYILPGFGDAGDLLFGTQ